MNKRKKGEIESMANAIKSEVLRHLVHDDLRSEQAEKVSRTLKVVDAPAKPVVQGRVFKTIPASQYSRYDYIKGLSRGDVVGIRGWTLTPPSGVAIVASVCDTLITMTDGRRFNRPDGFSNDGNKLMISPLTDRVRYQLITKVRNKLGIL